MFEFTPFNDLFENLGIAFLFAGLMFLAFGFFTGLDAQAEFIVSQPGKFFLAASNNQNVETGRPSKVVFSRSQIDDMNFVTQRSLGFDSIGSEKGFCGGINPDGTVSDFRVADITFESSRDSISFGCGKPNSLTMHSQPRFSSELSSEDKSFDDEIRPVVTCIKFRESVVSPVSGRVSGVNCWRVVSGGSSFVRLPVLVSDNF